MKRIRYSKEAAEELSQAANWYETECTGLGAKFYHAVDGALQLLKEDSPPLVPIYGNAGVKGAKRLLLNRFPFSLIVLPTDDEIIILAVAHHHRRPNYWANRF
jgi:toxin ParE1/3/4